MVQDANELIQPPKNKEKEDKKKDDEYHWDPFSDSGNNGENGINSNRKQAKPNNSPVNYQQFNILDPQQPQIPQQRIHREEAKQHQNDDSDEDENIFRQFDNLSPS